MLNILWIVSSLICLTAAYFCAKDIMTINTKAVWYDRAFIVGLFLLSGINFAMRVVG